MTAIHQQIHRRRRMVRTVDAVAQAHLIKLLLDGQHTCHQLADTVGLGYNTVLRYCRELHMRQAVHIHAWAPNKVGVRVPSSTRSDALRTCHEARHEAPSTDVQDHPKTKEQT